MGNEVLIRVIPRGTALRTEFRLCFYTQSKGGSEIREKVSQINLAIFRNGKWVGTMTQAAES